MNVRIAVFAALAGFLAACHKPIESTAQGQPRSKPIHVETVVAAAREVPTALLLAGQLKASQEAELAANASGLVRRTMVERGSYLARGEAIAQLDTRMSALTASEADAALQTARTQRALAEAECARHERLFRRGAITEQEYERQTASCKTAATSTEAAEARTREARQMLSDATIRAPFPGLVSERYVNVGEYVRPDTRIAHLVDIDPLRLELTVPEANLAAVKQGETVEFQVAAFPGRTFRATVVYIGPSVRATTRDLVFEATVPNGDKLLRPGLFATARLEAGTHTLPVVPKGALVEDGDTTRLFAVADGHLEERVVQTGPAVGDMVSVSKGLAAGERVVAHPDERVSDGVDVE